VYPHIEPKDSLVGKKVAVKVMEEKEGMKFKNHRLMLILSSIPNIIHENLRLLFDRVKVFKIYKNNLLDDP